MVSTFSVTLFARLLYYLKPFVAGKQQTDLLMKSLLPRGYMYLDPQPGSVMDCHLSSRSVLVGECPCIFIPWKSLSTVQRIWQQDTASDSGNKNSYRRPHNDAAANCRLASLLAKAKTARGRQLANKKFLYGEKIV